MGFLSLAYLVYSNLFPYVPFLCDSGGDGGGVDHDDDCHSFPDSE